MEAKTFSKPIISEANNILRLFYMIGFDDSNRDAGEERFYEQMGYPRNEPHGDLSIYARQAVLALKIKGEETRHYVGERHCRINSKIISGIERIVQLDDQIEYLEETFIKPVEERMVGRVMPDNAIAKPEWLTPKIQEDVAGLWKTENLHIIGASNPRVIAVKLIQKHSGNAGYNIGIGMATEIIKQHCL